MRPLPCRHLCSIGGLGRNIQSSAGGHHRRPRGRGSGNRHLGAGLLMVRLKDQRHAPAFHFAVAFDLAVLPKLGLDTREDFAAQFKVGHFAPFELKRELNFVPFLQENAGMIDFDL